MPNQLIHQTSPYLLQHADNPVDWYPWGDEALQRARQENKPIFLSIGYAACHWCHVMAHESFENEQIAEILNAYFIPIKVDREERPDLDSIYMSAVVAMTGQGGWPMSVFLTPQGQPFYGGTYFPPTARHGLPSFREVLLSVAEAWKQKRTEIEHSAENLTQYIQQNQAWTLETGTLIAGEKLQNAAEQLLQNLDPIHGGWGTAPKFPAPMSLDFLLLQYQQGQEAVLQPVLHTLHEMQKGGLYDVVGGGFHRYATDPAWLIPHFEKMLYDNAQLALTYLHAWLITGEPTFRSTCEDTLDFMVREMRHPQGGFYSSLDADSEGREGKFYLWTPEQIHAALSTQPDLEELVRFTYPVTSAGNFEGRIILRREREFPEIASRFALSLSELSARLQKAHELLRAFRSHRIRPATDDKILTFWNALALRAFAEAARYLSRPDYLEIARQNARFLLQDLYKEGRLQRSWREGFATQPAFLEDHTAFALGLLSLYQSSPEQNWFTHAKQLLEDTLTHFQAPDGSFHAVGHDQKDLIVRPREIQDNVTPSGNALAAHALLSMAIYTGHEGWQNQAEALLSSVQEYALQHPAAFAYWLQVLEYAVHPVDQLALLLPPNTPAPDWVVHQLWSAYRPATLFAQSSYPPAAQAPLLLQFRPLENGQPTLYLCHGTTCLPAITSEAELKIHLR